MNKKIVGSYQHNVYVSATTKKEFKKNKDQFKSEGIRSAYSLQKQKNNQSKMYDFSEDAFSPHDQSVMYSHPRLAPDE